MRLDGCNFPSAYAQKYRDGCQPLPVEFSHAYKQADTIVLEAPIPDPSDAQAQMKMLSDLVLLVVFIDVQLKIWLQLFKKTYNIYFKDYLLQVRIEEAKKLLKRSDLRIYEVAEKVGFGSPDYFVTQFEKKVGSTPSQYRQRVFN